MQILTGSEIFSNNIPSSVVTIGNFDGVHRGHLEIFRRLMLTGDRCALPSVVVTFEPHPLKVLAPGSAPLLITTFDQKAALIADVGIDWLVVVPFSEEFARMSADAFVREILCSSLGMRHIIIGHDYAFGRGREGNFETLERLGAELGFTLQDLPPIGENDTVFSSSMVRRLIAGGDMSTAATLLGRYHAVSGRVVHGREVGATIGFPTANIVTKNELIPPDGVYAVKVLVDDRLHDGACNIGNNPTFGGMERTIEVFLLDYSGQLYDKTVAVYFVRRLRETKKFPDIESLIKAINQDVATTRTVLAAVGTEMVRPLSGWQQRGAV